CGAIDDFWGLSPGEARICPSHICGGDVVGRRLPPGAWRHRRTTLWLASGTLCGGISRAFSRPCAAWAWRPPPRSSIRSRANLATVKRARICFLDCGRHLHHLLDRVPDFLGCGLRGEL